MIRGHPPNFAAIFSCWGGSFFHSLLSCSSLRLHFFAFRFRRFSSDAFSEGTVSCSALLSGEEACVFSFSSGLLRLLFCLIERCRILIRLQLLLPPCRVLFRGAFPFPPAARHAPVLLYPGVLSGIFSVPASSFCVPDASAVFMPNSCRMLSTVGKSSVFRADLIEQFFSRCLICPLTLQQRLLFRRPHLWGCIFVIFYPSCTCAIPCASIVWIWSSHKA